jgi:hypothetical protein
MFHTVIQGPSGRTDQAIPFKEDGVMSGNFSAFSALKRGCLLIVWGLIGLGGFLGCSRDNPIDPRSDRYVPGTAPLADFPEDTTTGFIRDSISMVVDFSDTQARGGATPGVTRLLFGWNGDSAAAGMRDTVSVSGSGSVTVRRYFTAPVNAMVFVRAQDNDGSTGPASGMRLIVDEGKPKIASRPVTLPADSVLTGDQLAISTSASDTNGTIAAYIWTLLGKDTATTDSVLRYIFPGTAAGMQTVYVRVIDDDGAVSLRDSVTVKVYSRNDTAGPAVTFVSPANNAVVTSQIISIILQAGDPSGVLFVNVNGPAATRISGTDLLGVYQRDNVPLDTGLNVILVQSMDKSVNLNQSWDTLRVNYQKPDYTPPSIAFSYPDSGETVYQSPVIVTVSVTDLSGVSWVLCGSDTMVNPTGSVYTSNVNPVEGTNSLIIRARDTRGNIAVDTLPFEYLIRDKTPPVVDITAPLSGALIAADSVDVAVQASDTGTYASGIAAVTVNGLPAALTMGEYRRKTALSHGNNTIRAIATDGSPVANQSRDSVVVIQDRPPHFVPDTSVKDTGLWVDSTASITLNAVDPDGDALIFSFVTNPAKASAFNVVKAGNSAVITYTADSAGLDTFRVQVADSVYGLGDTILVRVTNTVPDLAPPAILFVTPHQGDTVHLSPVTVMVNVTDPSGVAWVRCNDSAMTNTSGNSWSRSVTLGAEGAQSFVISAADTRNNTGADTLHFVYMVIRDTTRPVVAVVSPLTGQRIAANTVQVTVAASDTGSVRSGVDSVTINGAPMTMSAGYYSATVSLMHGFDTLRAVAVDSSGNRSRDSVIVLRNALPQFYPDVAVKDTNLWLDSAQTIQFIATDPDGDALVFDTISSPQHNSEVPSMSPEAPGYAHLAGYRPNVVGLDTFKVKVTDAWGGVDTLKVRVTVIDKGSLAPYFTISAPPDTAFLDSLYSVALTAQDPAGNLPLLFSLDYAVTPAAVSINPASGQLSWTPTVQGPVTVRAIVTNTISLSDTLEWLVRAVLRNYPPVIMSGPVHNYVDEGQLIQFTHPVSDTNGDVLRYYMGLSYPDGPTVDSVTGYVSWTPNYTQDGLYLLKFIVRERDRSPALSDSVTDTITVANVNRPPVIVDPGSRTGYENASISFYLSASDPDNNPITFLMNGAPANAQIVNGNNFVWTPDNSQGGVYYITFIAADNDTPQLRDSVIDTFTVIDTTKPVFGMHTALDTAWVGFPYATPVYAADPDTDVITYAKLAGPAALTVVAATGYVIWAPAAGDAGTTVSVQVTAADPSGNSDTMTWNVTVLVPDYPPVLADPGNRTVTEGQTLYISLSASDPNGDSLSYVFGPAPPAGAVLDTVNGIFSWTPTYKQAGVYAVAFMVREKNRVPALTDTVFDTITVNDTNMAPDFVAPPDGAAYSRYELQNIQIVLNATDVNGDTLLYSMTGAPSGASIVPGNRFTWTPSSTQGGQTYSVLFRVSDTLSGNPPMRDSTRINITVTDTTKPVFVEIGTDTAYALSPYNVTVVANDADADVVTYSKLSGPDSLKVDKYGIITWTPQLKDTTVGNSPVQVRVRAQDGDGNYDTLTYGLLVLPRWPRIYLNPASGDTGLSVIQMRDGNYAACGAVGDFAFFMMTDTSGNQLQYQTYGRAGRRWSARCIRQISDVGFILCGTDTAVSGASSRLILLRIDSKGDTLWTTQYNPPAPFISSTGASVVCLSDGSYVACGTAINRAMTAPAAAMYVVRAEPDMGNKIWERMYYTGVASPTTGSAGYCIQQTKDDGFIVSGEIIPGGTLASAIYLVKTNPIGDTLWTRGFRPINGSGARNAGLSVDASSDGSGYVVAGFSRNTSGTILAVAVKTTMAGDSLWRWGGPAGQATAVHATSDRGCIISGYTGPLGAEEATLFKLTTAGLLTWTSHYNLAGNDRAYDVALTTQDDGYILTGFATPPAATAVDILLLKTDKNGEVVK